MNTSSKILTPLKLQRHISAPKFTPPSSLEQISYLLQLSVEKTKCVLAKQTTIDQQDTAAIQRENKFIQNELKQLSNTVSILLDIRASQTLKESDVQIKTSRSRYNDSEVTNLRANIDNRREVRLSEEFKSLREKIALVSSSDYLFNLKHKLTDCNSSIKKLSKQIKDNETRPESRGFARLQEMKCLQKELMEVKNEYMRVSQKLECIGNKPAEYIAKNSQIFNAKYQTLVEECYGLDIDPKLSKSYFTPSQKQIAADKLNEEKEKVGKSLKNIQSKINRLQIESESTTSKLQSQIQILTAQLHDKIQ